jgi:hypothetical protein
MPAPQPGRSTRARWIIRTQLAAVSPARRHTPGIHTRATGFLPFTSPARYAVAAAGDCGLGSTGFACLYEPIMRRSSSSRSARACSPASSASS